MKVGFIGLGKMGQGMARNLLAAGHELTVYNRTREKAEALGRQGARVVDSPAEAARGAEAIVTMLANDRALEGVVFGEKGIIANLGRGSIHVSSSTISADLSERLAEAHARAGQGYVAAPVFGRPDAAEAGKLWLVIAGAKANVERCRPLFEALGRGLTVVGERPPGANVAKLAGNFLTASTIEALAESVALTRKSGIEPKVFLEAYESAMGRGQARESYGPAITEAKYQPAGFRLELGAKDIGLVMDAARSHQVPMPFASLLDDHFLSALAQGMGELDWSALGQLAAERAGLEA